MNGVVDASVVTPSFNMLGYLRRSCASVADQAGATHEHLVIDGGSTDGTPEWLTEHPEIAGVVEHDLGLYDAVNKGFRRARGELLSHLNCDEQYLPGALAFVREYFGRHPEVDILFGDALVIRPDGSLIAFRKGFAPLLPVILSGPLYLFTAAMFVQRRVIAAGEVYDSSYRNVGDVEFVTRLLRKGYTVRHVRRYLSAFTMTGNNLGTYTDRSTEVRRARSQAPWWIRRLRPGWRLVGWGTKLTTGAYSQGGPIEYDVYTSDDARERTPFVVQRASWRWRTA